MGADDTARWDALAGSLDAFIALWAEAEEAPRLEDHVPPVGDPAREFALGEMVKVDIEARAQRGSCPPLSDYLERFPDLDPGDGPPADVLHEAFRAERTQGGEPDPEAWLDRYPARAEALWRLLQLGGEAPKEDGPADLARDLPNIGDVIDDFLIVDFLGRGGFAAVYLARQRSMGRTVALKISRDTGDEARTLAQLDHPNIVRVFDQRRLPEQDLRLLYMEYVPAGALDSLVAHLRSLGASERSGRTLLAWVDERLEARGETKPAPTLVRVRLERSDWPRTVTLIGRQIADALSYAHGRGVLHRDLKPGNVLLGRDGRAKLADFNISFASSVEGATAEDQLGGSLAYMAPEQLEAVSPMHDREAAQLGPAVDVYALGVVLFELLAGERPFQDEAGANWATQVEAMLELRRSEAGRIAERLPANTPPICRDVVRACLAVDEADRPKDAAAVRDRLELALDPTLARLYAPTVPTWVRAVRRAPLLAILLAALIPNALLSGLNILYNAQVVVQETGRQAFFDKVSVVNGVAFAIGIAWLIWWLLPVARHLRGDGESGARWRQRLLASGLHLAWLILPLWVLGGLAFPVWLALETGSSGGDAWFHFGVSNALFGVLAASASFLGVSRFSVRALYPALRGDAEARAADAATMRRVRRGAFVWLFAFTAVPFVSIVILALGDIAWRQAYLALGIIGALGFALAFFAAMATRRELSALLSRTDELG